MRRAALYALMAFYYLYTRIEPSVYAAGFLYLLTLYFVSRFFKRYGLFGTLFSGLGVLLNATVILANGGYMPSYDIERASRGFWKAVEEDTVFPQLADGYLIPLVSIGDILCLVGVVLVACELATRFTLERIRLRPDGGSLDTLDEE